MSNTPDKVEYNRQYNQKLRDQKNDVGELPKIKNPKPPTWKKFDHEAWLCQMANGPPYRCSQWFGPMPDSHRMHFHRALKKLVAMGLLTTWARWGDRVTNIQLTKTGKQIAKQLSLE